MRTALQQALFDFLDGQLELASVPVALFDSVPQKTLPPYIVIGNDDSEPADTDDSRGVEAVCEISIWTGYDGRKEVKAVADALYARLHQARLTVEGYSLAVAFWVSSNYFDESDGVTRHGVEEYRVLLQE